jgi:ubiquinone/menaquinone biosynthesis C-methylase UbiE
MNENKVKNNFNTVAKGYDRFKTQIIPGYREVEKLMQSYVLLPKDSRVNILELGTGTGQWASRMLKRFSNAHYNGVDFSENMLSLASQNLRSYADRVNLQNLDLNRDTLTGRYDLIYSSFALHHIEDKQIFFKMIHKLLKRKGRFLYIDVTSAHSRNLEKLFMESWERFMRKSACPDNKIRKIINDHLEHDIPETVENQLKFLQRAGYKNYELIWRFEKFAAIYAQK